MFRYNIYFFFAILILSIPVVAQKDTSFVKLRTGETIYGKVEYKTQSVGASYILIDDSIKYLLSKIDAYKINDYYFGRVKGKNNFVTRIVEGNINLYRETVFNYVTPQGNYGSLDFDYISKGNEAIIDASYSNLLAALAYNNVSIEHIKTYQTMKYLGYGMLGGGLALAITGLATGSKDKPNTGLMVGGLIVAVASWVPYLISKSEYDKAIESYNQH